MIEDAELLRRYVQEKSDAAFAELVERHLAFVYASALRQVGGDTSAAQDVAQSVFVDLARKAVGLSPARPLVAWLFISTRYAATHRVRADQRRRVREQKAHVMESIDRESAHEPNWEELRAVLDDVLQALAERDRELILLRFFENRAFADIGARYAVTADAARLRVERALEKMRVALSRRGVTSTAAALALTLAQQPAVAIPTGLSAAITTAAVAGGGPSALATFFAMNKLQIVIASAIALTGATVYVAQAETHRQLDREVTEMRRDSQQIASLENANAGLAQHLSEADALRRDNEALTRSLAESPAAVAVNTSSAPSASSEPIFDISIVERPPTVKMRVPPVYPRDLRQAGIGGEVLVGFVVTSRGQTSDVHVIRSTRPEFESAAVAAVKQWVFEPAEKNGKSCNTQVQMPIVFSVDRPRPSSR